tara:strand:- start:112 stop:225 length:114 start_codon:yes stop_codon:yes gene_type:complete
LPDGISFGSYARKIIQAFIEFANKNNKKYLHILKEWL